MIDFKQILPNWRVEIKEISNNVYQFIAKNGTGKRVEITEPDYHYGYRKCMADSFDIELQSNRDNKFLYDTFLRLIDNNKIKEHRYDHYAFGSWFIQTDRKRIVLEGRDFELRIDKNIKNEWVTTSSVSVKNNIKLTNVELIVNEFK